MPFLKETQMEETEIAHLKPLFESQGRLDAAIHANHKVNYEVTRPRRILALLVEIGEFANTTRCFKYWSSKGMEDKDTVLDEYADGMHFFLSLGIDIKTTKVDYEVRNPGRDLVSQIHLVYSRIEDFKKDPQEIPYVKAFSAFLNILPLIGFTFHDAELAYYKKLNVNYNRQETNY